MVARLKAKIIVKETALVLMVYGGVTWGYVAAYVLDPATTKYQTWPLSVYIHIPTDLVGITAFVVSAISALIWRLASDAT